MTDLVQVLACPRCGGPLREAEPEHAWLCTTCGGVGGRTLGFPDFLVGQRHLLSAAGGTFDLLDDGRAAAELAASNLSHRELVERVTREVTAPPDLPERLVRGRERYSRHYQRIQTEVQTRAGHGDIDKVNAHLHAAAKRPLGGALALEAGGGEGLHLAGLCSTFDHVVFLDCSLVYLVIARQLAEELALKNVTFVRGDLTALPFAASTMDFVHESGVIEHVALPQIMVTEALRVLATGGTYLCLSPNLYPITPEAHFRLPLFGLIPRWVRRLILPRFRGVNDEAGTDLRSLGQLRRYFAAAGEADAPIFFLPRELQSTVRQTPVRRALRFLLRTPGVGTLIDVLLNRILLPIMPYQMVVVSRSPELSVSAQPQRELSAR